MKMKITMQVIMRMFMEMRSKISCRITRLNSIAGTTGPYRTQNESKIKRRLTISGFESMMRMKSSVKREALACDSGTRNKAVSRQLPNTKMRMIAKWTSSRKA